MKISHTIRLFLFLLFSSIELYADGLKKALIEADGLHTSLSELNDFIRYKPHSRDIYVESKDPNEKDKIIANNLPLFYGFSLKNTYGYMVKGKVVQLHFILSVYKVGGRERMGLDAFEKKVDSWKERLEKSLKSKGKPMSKIKNSFSYREGYFWTLPDKSKIILHQSFRKFPRDYSSQLDFKPMSLQVSRVSHEQLPAFIKVYNTLDYDESNRVKPEGPDLVKKILGDHLTRYENATLRKAQFSKTPNYYVLFYRKPLSLKATKFGADTKSPDVHKYNLFIKNSSKIEFIMVSLEKSDASLKAWSRRYKFPWLMIRPDVAKSHNFLKGLTPTRYPYFIILDRTGKQLKSGRLWEEIIKLAK